MSKWEGPLVDRLYEAAVIPELWPGVCERISAGIGAFSTAIICISPDGMARWVSSAAIAEQMERYGASDLRQRNIRPARALTRAPGAFMRDIDLLTDEELARDPMRIELLEPIGLGWEMGCAIAEPSGAMLVTSILRRTADGPFAATDADRMDALKPDLARASFLATRLAFSQAQSITQTLSTVGLAAAVLTLSGKVLSMNADMEKFAPRLRVGARDYLIVKDAAAKNLLQAALLGLKHQDAPVVQSIPIAADFGEPVLVLQLLPVRRDARDIFGPATAILIATAVGHVGPPDARVICSLFDLTPAEGRIAQRVVGGEKVGDIAAALGIGQETVRTHLKSIYRKTGVNRQSKLVSLLLGIPHQERALDHASQALAAAQASGDRWK
jgi:DNA-binding CsgD family transcriptional regulator